jgi:hypothetical protein
MSDAPMLKSLLWWGPTRYTMLRFPVVRYDYGPARRPRTQLLSKAEPTRGRLAVNEDLWSANDGRPRTLRLLLPQQTQNG